MLYRKTYERLPQSFIDTQDCPFNIESKKRKPLLQLCLFFIQSLAIKISRRPILVYIICLLLMVFLVHAFISYRQIFFNKETNKSNFFDNLKSLNSYTNDTLEEDLQTRIQDLLRIKTSFMNELISLEKEKENLVDTKESLQNRYNKLLVLIVRSQSQLKQLELDISANRRRLIEHSCEEEQIPLLVFKPLHSVNINDYQDLANTKDLVLANKNKYEFDYVLCPLTVEFEFKLTIDTNFSDLDVSTFARNNYIDSFYSLVEALKTNSAHITSPVNHTICLNVVLNYPGKETLLSELEIHANNLVINFDLEFLKDSNTYEKVQSRAIIASPYFKSTHFRRDIDIVIPSIMKSIDNYDTIIGSMPPISPIERRYLASFFGNSSSNDFLSSKQKSLIDTLSIIHRNSIEDWFLFKYDCSIYADSQCLIDREQMIESSVYLVIIPPNDDSLIIDSYINYLLYSALSKGTIPVIVGGDNIALPYQNSIDWKRASIIIPAARLTELQYILRSISHTDVYKLKLQGRFLFERYFVTVKQVVDSLIATISLNKLNYSPKPVQKFKIKDKSVFKQKTKKVTIDIIKESLENTNDSSSVELLGPREMPFEFVGFSRNTSLTLTYLYDLWNDLRFSPFEMSSSTPFDPIAPSEYKFYSRDKGYRPIGDGLGGSGYEFSESLGGDYPNEQFTIIILTYERQSILLKTISKLKGLPYLNKVIVVWNSVQKKPSSDLQWPELDVPIVVVYPTKNSLNNRFLPFDDIETEAVLCLDDDSPLRQDEIIFAFRVWRQSRDRIVGFPGRFHAFDNEKGEWLYNSNHSCEISMVLTGGAFIHVYYMHYYTNHMPNAIKSIIDQYMNCEDIAMNFAVAHLTRQPPIKVTSRWTFHCPMCPNSLSEDESHFRERHECLNAFASIYGYMPLVNTQHRSDSILFKTRIPSDKQKCFKYV